MNACSLYLHYPRMLVAIEPQGGLVHRCESWISSRRLELVLLHLWWHMRRAVRLVLTLRVPEALGEGR
jgi:hypothetical protein